MNKSHSSNRVINNLINMEMFILALVCSDCLLKIVLNNCLFCLFVLIDCVSICF